MYNLDKDATLRVKRMEVAMLYDELFETIKWNNELPFLSFRPNWLIKVCPPFLGAGVRFFVTKKSLPKGCQVSIYFDPYASLGHMGRPYWEIYGIDTRRYYLGEEAKMMDGIEEALEDLRISEYG